MQNFAKRGKRSEIRVLTDISTKFAVDSPADMSKRCSLPEECTKICIEVFGYAESIFNRIHAGKQRDPTQNQETQDGRPAYCQF